MSEVSAALPQAAPLSRFLESPRYEVIPVAGIEQKVAGLPWGATVTVTASPRHGVDRTLDVSTALAARGYRVVPHLAARMVAGRGHLERLVQRLDGAGIREAFVVGGDASPPAGPFADAGDLLEELARLSHPFARIGVGGYPEGHPLIPDERLLEALLRKQPLASYVVTQLCFDADAYADWLRRIRAVGVDLPVVAGIPGVIERRRLAEVSLRSGVGASLRYLRTHGRQLGALTRTRRFDPTPLAEALTARVAAARLELDGVHLFTFNQVDATRAWVARHS